MDDTTMRADAALFMRGLAASREKAHALIEAGLATVNGQILSKPAQKVSEGDVLCVTGELHPYVGRGGLKLEKALRVFGVDPAGQVCMDIGASTGGFTDVLLKNGAAHVYAIDVGSGQLAPALCGDPRVTNMEHVNARALTRDMFPVQPTLGVMDVSFISIKLILPAAFSVMGEHGHMICLVKPQFEAGRGAIGKHGIVSKPSVHVDVLRDIASFSPAPGIRVRAMDFSPICGGDGNIEYLAYFAPTDARDCVVTDAEILEIVRLAHNHHKKK